jgi:hypothetical protein
MSNVKISSLPSYTGNTSGSWLVMNNSGETTTYKIKKENYIFPYNGNATITGSLIVSSSVSSGANLIISNRSNGTNFIEGGGNVISSFGGPGHFANNDILAYNGGFNTISGSANILKGPTTITGSVTTSGSLVNFNTQEVRITGSNAGVNIISKPATGSALTQFFIGGSGANWNNTNTFTSQESGASWVGVQNVSTANLTQGVYLIRGRDNFQMTDITTSGSGQIYNPFLTLGNNISGSNPAPQMPRGLGITGSLTVSGSIIQTGSVQGNIVPLTITSNTASLDLSQGSSYTLQLVSGSNTFINPTNIRPGYTINLLVNTVGSATVTFPGSVKQPFGLAYTPTTSTGKDILTLATFDSSSVYLASVKNMV